jgi:hypothetical protein
MADSILRLPAVKTRTQRSCRGQRVANSSALALSLHGCYCTCLPQRPFALGWEGA